MGFTKNSEKLTTSLFSLLCFSRAKHAKSQLNVYKCEWATIFVHKKKKKTKKTKKQKREFPTVAEFHWEICGGSGVVVVDGVLCGVLPWPVRLGRPARQFALPR